MILEQRMDGAAQISNAFAVDEAHLEDSALPAGGEIIEHQVLHLRWFERVQIQHAIYWKLKGLVIHIVNIQDFSEERTRNTNFPLACKSQIVNRKSNESPAGMKNLFAKILWLLVALAGAWAFATLSFRRGEPVNS